ncbi:isoprenylcysteine carboxylmethyltransferase family protein [Flavobacterium amniphilum]|uniref:methyltransferase family protein n=1 Tax=Flavobacterium amniphilum TaxID=1834035 RepID=UPI00202AAF0A|nr:isoprenylcysteine carboxylmethyltransferase family protein [Flavobacterium amniphilum]MCL9807533.1 isoprenylcysteine carboxylmethyltransferase family protein [Flavobacterium amniphilum]
MTNLIPFILLLYFILYFGIAFVAKSLIVAKRIGKNPLVLPKDNSAYGLVGRYFKMMLIALFLYILVFAFIPSIYTYFLPFPELETMYFKFAGITLLVISFILTVIAQSHMKNSWRIGIDEETKTELITSGLFSYSRNPIFLGMIISLLGLFLTTPNVLTLIFLIIGYTLIQIQIVFEEDFLTSLHGQNYIDYKQKVRRYF